SVYSGESSVLLSPAAEDVHAILVACASRRSAPYAIAAALTRSLGATSGDVRARRDAWIGAIRSCARTLERRGIDAALVELLERPVPNAREGEDAGRSAIELLLAQAGGERHAVDLQHMRELLGEAERTGTHGAAALAHWIVASRDAIERAGGRGSGDTARLRTQATRDAVTLQTLHSSKGLTYSLVCLPTIALASRQQADLPLVRATEADGHGGVCRIIDVGSPRQPDRARAHQQEHRRERSRLLYVAMTRARYVTCVCVPLEPAAKVVPSALEELLGAQVAAASATRMQQLKAWSDRSAAVHARLDPPGEGSDAAGHPGSARGTAVRIDTEAPRWAGAPWSAPSMGEMAPLDPPVVAWADLHREASFTSLSSGASRAGAADGADEAPAEREMDERVEPDPTRSLATGRGARDMDTHDPADAAEHDAHGGSAASDAGADASGCASALDGALRRLGVRGVELGVAMHAALDVAFGSLAEPGQPDAGAAGASADFDSDRLARRIAAECVTGPGSDAQQGVRAAARGVAQALRAALSQPLGYGCPSVTDLAGRQDTVLRELRISRPMSLRQDLLADAFAAHGGDIGARVAPALARVASSQVRGLLSGIIDIAAHVQRGQWHIIDWKTNDLGRDPGSYSGRALEDAAASSLYPVQAALYMMLLSRWLRRIGDPSEVVASHYLYLRGMDASTPGVGVWSWAPGPALVEALDRAVGDECDSSSAGGVP
ncbi:MAG: hypothetical protein FGM37_11025, partial [Phycisphaerales bacterium]|nr:hypothetical protein [Phycisphaerales bacterium]